MSIALIDYSLLAQVARWQRLGDGLHRSRGRMDLTELWPLLLVVVLIGIGIGALAYMRKRNDMTERCDDPNKLFRELSLVHQLDRGSQKLLWQLADALQVAQPAAVFLQPELFDPQKLPAQLRGEAERLAELRERLF